ncbi:MAG: exosortase/archaeosortase family protein [Gemmataceae bacterium]|nr:exosortase/archaeosortase family protein [Gemmataceae bacterium]
MTQPLRTAGRAAQLWPFLALPLALGSLIWAYWPTLVDTARTWAHDPQYSHGYLVPLFALALLWFRRDRCPAIPLQPTWWGATVLALGLGLRLFGTYYFYVWLGTISFIPALAGLCLMIGGWAAWRWAWPSIAFIAFMLPLPYTLSIQLTGPLQELATTVCTFLLQTIGIPAIAEGNVILLSEVDIGIVEACSGLRMLVIFFALSTAVALLIRRPLGEKIVIALSAAPIALISNIIRITVTGVLHETVGSEIANMVFHDLAGWLMMPLALGMLWLELQFLARLWLPEPVAAPRRTAAPRTMRTRTATRLALRPGGAA